MNFGFPDIYANWLPKHLEYLNKGSIEILEALNPNEFEHVRYSTVVSINSLKHRNTFDRNILLLVNNLNPRCKNVLLTAVHAS